MKRILALILVVVIAAASVASASGSIGVGIEDGTYSLNASISATDLVELGGDITIAEDVVTGLVQGTYDIYSSDLTTFGLGLGLEFTKTDKWSYTPCGIGSAKIALSEQLSAVGSIRIGYNTTSKKLQQEGWSVGAAYDISERAFVRALYTDGGFKVQGGIRF